MILFTDSETLWAILRSPAHWIAEIIVTLLFDGMIVGLFWPIVCKGWRTWLTAREFGVRAKLTEHLVDSAPSCNTCGALPTRLDTSVDLCFGCGDVRVPKRSEPLRSLRQSELEEVES